MMWLKRVSECEAPRLSYKIGITQWRVILESQLIDAIELTPGRLAITKQVASYFDKKGCAYDSCVVQNLIPTWRRLFPSSVRPAHLGLGSPSERVRKRVIPGHTFFAPC